jgi:23S rRNA (cytidine1920-2'-O)/16S rRNA (cytidine1409-2'-O)-methyltransferase
VTRASVRAATLRHAGERLDQWLVAHGHARTRSEAQGLVLAGRVTLNGAVTRRPGQRVAPGAAVDVRRDARFVSRGGMKLAHALAAFGIDPRGAVAVDLGASTGGFTECLLRAGAARVYAVDVGRGLLDWSLRTDPRVVSLEGRNARFLTPDDVGGPVDLVTADLAFISLRLVWPAIAALLRDGGSAVVLIKPQFEAGRAQVGRGGVVRDPAVHRAVLAAVLAAARRAGLAPLAVTPSPILGPAGNGEFLAHLRKGGTPRPVAGEIEAAVSSLHARPRPQTNEGGQAAPRGAPP